MYDRSLRRRRIALALLVAASLLLLTMWFGESAGGGLHSVQKGVLQVVSPIQEGASRALKPVRDLVGWVGDTVKAKGQVSDLKKENTDLRNAAIAGVDAKRQNIDLQKLLDLQQTVGSLAAAAPVSARVIGQSPTLWYSTITIDKGSSSGVRAGQAVITGDGLVGQVIEPVAGNSAAVRLITDSEFAVGARLTDSGRIGYVRVGSGGPDDLQLTDPNLTSADRVKVGEAVVTSGTVSQDDKYESQYLPGIPIGEVTKADGIGSDDPEIHLKPYADLRGVEFVRVLTKKVNGNRP